MSTRKHWQEKLETFKELMSRESFLRDIELRERALQQIFNIWRQTENVTPMDKLIMLETVDEFNKRTSYVDSNSNGIKRSK